MYNICLKAKFENFRGENVMRYFAIKVYPHDTPSFNELGFVASESRDLLDRLKKYQK
jgi:hypothetical protein